MKLYPDLKIIEPGTNSTQFIVDNIANTDIKESSIHGYGLFSKNEIDSGTILCILDGQIVSWDSYDNFFSTKPFGRFDDYLFMEWNALDYNVLMVRPFRTKYSFINHSRNPNLILRRYPVALITLRPINPGEELTIDYRKEPLRKEYLEKATYL